MRNTSVMLRPPLLPLLPLLAFLPLLLGPAPAAGEDAPALERRAYDLSWLGRSPSVPGEALGLTFTAPDRSAWEDEAEEDSDGREQLLSTDALQGLVRDLVHPELWEGSTKAQVALDGGRLVVTAPSAVQAEVAAFLDALWSELSVRVRLEAQLLRLSAEAFDALPAEGLRAALLQGRPSAEQVRALVALAGQDGDAVRLATLACPGRWTLLARTTARTWLLDYDVEIAQDSVVANPQVQRVLTGLRLDLRPCVMPAAPGAPAPGAGRLVRLDVLVDIAEPLGEPRSVDLEADPFGLLDLPALRVLRLASVLPLASGETGALLVRTDDDVRVVLLSATVTGGPAPQPAAGALVRRIDLSALTLPRVSAGLTSEGAGPPVPCTPALRLELGPEGAPPLSQDDLLPWLAPQAIADAPRPWSLVEAGSLWAPRAEAEALSARVAAAGAPLLARERLVLSVRETPKGGAPRERAVLALDVASGLPFAVQHVVERCYVADWDVEVAQEARTGDPIPGVLSAGLFLSGRVDGGPLATRARVACDLVLSRQRGDFERMNPRNERTGIVERALLEVLRGNRDGPVTRGEPVLLELGTDEAGTRVDVELSLWR